MQVGAPTGAGFEVAVKGGDHRSDNGVSGGRAGGVQGFVWKG